ncbi:Acyl-CoA dehydrogenase/oxidase, N-terminal and middle domain [Pseudocohnilembus persalinus]|uniref:Acyl-CoA dehydrogenase/oxidase, N-terminal and middle domain n=1 Tax=Pseudocohnilembus persalinus TaxID=266149 RepID=A0A0V0Q8J2_PSEPJ|nr:Acyl-CoA dehydrogenase/oxidase, N-terminal and middle domain [Pseudocohnilembus persalinus]|eukprot:KRW98475.1 Acyl-CoA dehydrogenase/oxidase, N-terminal and middle domain [Pseudocohnilembus persalinus]
MSVKSHHQKLFDQKKFQKHLNQRDENLINKFEKLIQDEIFQCNHYNVQKNKRILKQLSELKQQSVDLPKQTQKNIKNFQQKNEKIQNITNNNDSNSQYKQLNQQLENTENLEVDQFFQEITYLRLKKFSESGLCSVEDVTKNPSKVFQCIELLTLIDCSLVSKVHVNYILFGGALQLVGNPQKVNNIIKPINTLDIIGCYALSEKTNGHSYSQIETYAKYNNISQSFTLNSPHDGSTKVWVANGYKDANYCIVYAKLIVNRQNEGVHPFLVRIREPSGKIPASILINDMPKTYGINGLDFAEIKFNNHQIPVDRLVSKNSKIIKNRFKSSLNLKQRNELHTSVIPYAPCGSKFLELSKGEGFLMENRIGELLSFSVRGISADGDNGLLLQKICKDLILGIQTNKIELPILNKSPKQLFKIEHFNLTDQLLDLMKIREIYLLRKIQNKIKFEAKFNQKTMQQLWQQELSDLIEQGALAFGYRIICELCYLSIARAEDGIKEYFKVYLKLYMIQKILENLSWYQVQLIIGKVAVKNLYLDYSRYIEKIGQFSLQTVESFGIPEVLINAPIAQDFYSDYMHIDEMEDININQEKKQQKIPIFNKTNYDQKSIEIKPKL